MPPNSKLSEAQLESPKDFFEVFCTKAAVSGAFKMNIVYVEAITHNADVQNEMYRMFRRLAKAKPDIAGLREMYPVTSQIMLNVLSSRRPELAAALQPLEGAGIWTEWDSRHSVGEFFSGPMHAEFARYASTTLDKARYRIVQLDGDEVKIREIPE